MLTIKVDRNNPNKKTIIKVVNVLQEGGVVILPTETVYTLAVDATNESAVKKIYKIKERDYNKPLHVVVSSLGMAKKYVYINSLGKKLANKFLPGPLTLIFKKRPRKLPNLLTSGLRTLGIRIPDLKINQEISRVFGKPYTTTSANKSSGLNPYTVKESLYQLDKNKVSLINLIVDAGPLPHLKPSTIVNVTGDSFKILRQGPIKKEEIEKAL